MSPDPAAAAVPAQPPGPSPVVPAAPAPDTAPPSAPTASTSAGARHDGIDALRGTAALLVVLFHMNQSGFGLTGPAWTQAGLLGVNLFFTLSGFLIGRSVMHPAVFQPRRYLESRARRILPNYFIALLVVITLVDVRSLLHVPAAHAAGDLITHATLTHGWFPPYAVSIMGPFWTLSHEWWFYMLMLAAAPLLRGPRRWWTVPLAMACTALLARWGHLEKWWTLPGGLSHPLALWDQFAAGIVAAGLTLRARTAGRKSAPAGPLETGRTAKPWLRPLLLTAGAALVLWSVWRVCQTGLAIDPEKYRGGTFGDRVMEKFWSRRSNVLWFTPLLAAGTAVLVAGLWLVPERGRRWKWLPVLPWMGEVSYSTYLWHMPVVLCYSRAFRQLPEDSFWRHPVAAFLLVLIMVYAFSAFAWRFFEVPWLRPAGSRQPRPVPGRSTHDLPS